MAVLDFTYSQQDCRRAWRRHLRETMNLPLDLAGALGLLVASAVYFVPLMAYRRDEKLKRPYHLCFLEDGIEFRTDNLSSQLGWQMYTNALIDQDSYLLYHGKSQFTIIPRRVLSDDRSRDEFERLIQMKIPTIVRRC